MPAAMHQVVREICDCLDRREIAERSQWFLENYMRSEQKSNKDIAEYMCVMPSTVTKWCHDGIKGRNAQCAARTCYELSNMAGIDARAMLRIDGYRSELVEKMESNTPWDPLSEQEGYFRLKFAEHLKRAAEGSRKELLALDNEFPPCSWATKEITDRRYRNQCATFRMADKHLELKLRKRYIAFADLQRDRLRMSPPSPVTMKVMTPRQALEDLAYGRNLYERCRPDQIYTCLERIISCVEEKNARFALLEDGQERIRKLSDFANGDRIDSLVVIGDTFAFWRVLATLDHQTWYPHKVVFSEHPEKVAQARSILEEAAATVADQFTEPHAVRLLQEYIDRT